MLGMLDMHAMEGGQGNSRKDVGGVEKIDLFKQFKDEYKKARVPELVETRPAQYLTIGGIGQPGGEEFKTAVEALYSMAFTIKMTRKGQGKTDYVVCKLEALWWVDGGKELAEVEQKWWRWKLMIRTPDFVCATDVKQAASALLDKGKAEAVARVYLESLEEGSCVQMLHVGPYEKEADTLAAMAAFMNERQLTKNGCHHEIYLSDPRRVTPDKLKTILRLPVVQKS